MLSKVDILEKVKLFKLIYNNEVISFDTLIDMTNYINSTIREKCELVINIIYSDSPEHVTIPIP